MKNSNSLILVNRNSINNLDKLLSELIQIINFDKYLKFILIIDNNSNDQSGEKIFHYLPKNKDIKIILIQNSKNYGMGGSLKISFNYFLKNINTENLLIMHTSGRTNIFTLYVKFINADIDVYDYLLMSRYHKDSKIHNYSLIRNLGNKLFNLLVFLFSGKYIQDHGSGIFLIKKQLLKKLNYNNFTNDSFFNPQMNIVISKKKMIKYIPVKWGESKVKSHLNIYSYALKLIFFLLQYFIFGDKAFKNKNDQFITTYKINE